MNLKEKLLSDLKGAMKAREALKVETLRILNSEIKNKEIEVGHPLEDESVVALLTRQIKQRKEAAALYAKGGRSDLREKEEQELAILEGYLPAQATEEKLVTRIREVIRETGAQGPRDLGKVMKVVAAEFKGKADGARLKDLVSQNLKA